MNISQLKEKFLKHFESPDEHETHDIHEGGFYNSTLVDTEDAVAEVFKGLENDTYKELFNELKVVVDEYFKLPFGDLMSRYNRKNR